MTKQERADELMNKFMFADIYFTEGKYGAIKNAKFCAILCAEELLYAFSFPTTPENKIMYNFYSGVLTILKGKL